MRLAPRVLVPAVTVLVVAGITLGVGLASHARQTRQEPHPVLHVNVVAGESFVDSSTGWRANQPASTGAVTVCVESPGSARITAVTPKAPLGGIRVVQWGLRPNPSAAHAFMLGGPMPTLLNAYRGKGGRSSGLFSATVAVTSVCGAPGQVGQELGVTYTKPSDGDAATGGLVIHYTAGGNDGTTQIPVDEVLCGPKSTGAPIVTPVPLVQVCHR